MHHCRTLLRRWLSLSVISLLIASCAIPPTQPQPPGADRQLAQAEKLSHDGKYQEAAQAYAALAAQSPKELRDRLLLRAAREYLNAGATAEVSLGKQGEGFGLAVELVVSLPGIDEPLAEKLVAAAHQVCPYSNATRGNIDVTLTVVS